MRVLLAHADLGAQGGAEAYARAIAARLRRDGHRVGLLDINGHLTPEGTRNLPPPLGLWARMPLPRRPHLMNWALVCRALPGVAAAYDRAILTYGEGPALPCPALRLLHAPALFSDRAEALSYLGAPSTGPRLALRQAHARLCRRIARPCNESAPHDLTIANSRWTATEAARLGTGTVDAVLYPPFAPLPRPAGAGRDPFLFAAIGRLVPNKRFDEIIHIVSLLRRRGLPARLHVMGRGGGGFARRLRRRARRLPFVTITMDATPPQLAELLHRAAFGIHACRHEHFGIAVAEMIKAGCLPFVHDGGGVRELVPDRELRFADATEAAARIEHLVFRGRPGRMAKLRALQAGPALGAALNFDGHLAPLLAQFLDQGEGAGRAAA